MSTLQVNIFGSAAAEYSNLLSANPSIDLTDAPVPAGACSPVACQLGSPPYFLTSPVPDTGYYEIQFMLANTYWNCAMQFGNSACGVNIRQAIAHMIDKTIFSTRDPNIPAGDGMAIDNPVPTSSGGGLLSANSCNWDSSFLEPNTVGTSCTVGGGTGTSGGGSSYHIAAATGVPSISCPWCQAPGSPDLNAAAQHLVNAGLATGFNTATSILTNPISTTGLTIPNLFAVANDPARLDLGSSLAAQICYLFTGSYTTPCAYLSYTPAAISAFNGFNTCVLSVCNVWWMFTAAYSGISFYDQSLFNIYNSRFVSGVPSDQPPCSAQAVPTSSATNYMYLCSPTYDSLSNQLETSGCLTAAGDPVVGATSNKPTSPGSGLCSNGSLSSHSAAIQAEDIFGQNAFTIPIFEKLVKFGYLQCQPPGPCATSNSWVRAINDASTGLPNYFTWLNVFNPGPALPGTIRQGFDEVTRSVNPYIASSIHDQYIVRSIYDSLLIQNPLSTTQFFNWMTEFEVTPPSLSYTPPPHTVLTYRFGLRPDLMWQDGRSVTSYDVAFSYLSMVGSGAYLGSSASMMTGITVLNSRVFDINVNSTGPFVLPNLTSLPIVPGRYWSNAGGLSWDNAVSTCGLNCGIAQYTLTGPPYTLIGPTVNPCISISGAACTIFPNTLMTVNPSDTAPSFDPILSHMMVGSGPWMCGNVSSSGSGLCTPDGKGNGESTSYTLTANVNNFRSSLNLAKYLWSGESDTNAIGPAAFVGACFNVTPPSLSGTCSHWQQGAGNPNSAPTGTVVGITAVVIVDIFFNLNWLSPFEWTTSAPLGIATLPPVLYSLVPFDGSTTLNPSTSGTSCMTVNSFYDC